MNQRFILTKFKDIRKDYSFYKREINYYLLNAPNFRDDPTYQQKLTEIGDKLDNKFDEFQLILDRGI